MDRNGRLEAENLDIERKERDCKANFGQGGQKSALRVVWAFKVPAAKVIMFVCFLLCSSLRIFATNEKLPFSHKIQPYHICNALRHGGVFCWYYGMWW